jgi:3-hydroxybutyryl-CoA dehydrogenase
MTIKRVGIVGSGTMGSGIAEVAAKNGLEVVLRSRSQSGADGMIQGLEKSLNKQVEKGKLAEADRDAALARVRGVTELKELADCDIVVESVLEDLAVKKELFAELDKICAPHTILATNTSTLPVVEMAVVTGRPGQVCGIHFFNPAPMMGLVEVIRAITSSDETRCGASRSAPSVRPSGSPCRNV